MPSRGERNNNPGNLEASPWTRKQNGYVGSDGRFAIFDSMANGIAAQAKLLVNSYLKKGHDTPYKVIMRYGNDAGPQDDVSVKNYIKYVAGRLGIGINDKVDVSKAGELAQAMREFETGKTKKGVATDAPDSEFNIGDYDPTGIVNSVSFVNNLFTAEFAARFSAVFIGIILIGLAVAAFTLLGKENVIAGTIGKLT